MIQGSSKVNLIRAQRYFRFLPLVIFLFCFSPLIGQDTPSSKALSEWTEQNALNVLEDPRWTHRIVPAAQAEACGYKNLPFPEEMSQGAAERGEIHTPTPESKNVIPEKAEYLLRFQSVKPVQEAGAYLADLDRRSDNFSHLVHEKMGDPNDPPTDLTVPSYNPSDMLAVTLILAKPPASGQDFFTYTRNEKGVLVSRGFQIWICTGLKTDQGATFAHMAPSHSFSGYPRAMTFLFPRIVGGKPLIAGPQEKVTFRMVAVQRVFETTFEINASDLADVTAHLYYSDLSPDSVAASVQADANWSRMIFKR